MRSVHNIDREAWLLLGLLAIATALLTAGLVMPLMTIKTLVFMRSTFSVFTGVYDLWVNGRYILFLLITLFSIVLPVCKLALLAAFIVGRLRALPIARRALSLAHEYGRWAMLDVMVVAILLVTVKLGAIASVEIHPGLYLFGAAVLLIMVVTQRVVSGLANSTSA